MYGFFLFWPLSLSFFPAQNDSIGRMTIQLGDANHASKSWCRICSFWHIGTGPDPAQPWSYVPTSAKQYYASCSESETGKLSRRVTGDATINLSLAFLTFTFVSFRCQEVPLQVVEKRWEIKDAHTGPFTLPLHLLNGLCMLHVLHACTLQKQIRLTSSAYGPTGGTWLKPGLKRQWYER